MSRTTFSAGSFLLIDFCLIFVPFGHYDEPEIIPYENTSVCPKGPDVRQRDLQFGMRGADVAWLRDKLPKTQGASADSLEPDTFDVDLQERGIAFQRSHDLIGDGIVTPLTLIHLNDMVDKSAVPVLTNNP